MFQMTLRGVKSASAAVPLLVMLAGWRVAEQVVEARTGWLGSKTNRKQQKLK
jgi:hypothetical protein